MACTEGDDGKVNELLEAGADPNVKVRRLCVLGGYRQAAQTMHGAMARQHGAPDCPGLHCRVGDEIAGHP